MLKWLKEEVLDFISYLGDDRNSIVERGGVFLFVSFVVIVALSLFIGLVVATKGTLLILLFVLFLIFKALVALGGMLNNQKDDI